MLLSFSLSFCLSIYLSLYLSALFHSFPMKSVGGLKKKAFHWMDQGLSLSWHLCVLTTFFWLPDLEETFTVKTWGVHFGVHEEQYRHHKKVGKGTNRKARNLWRKSLMNELMTTHEQSFFSVVETRDSQDMERKVYSVGFDCKCATCSVSTYFSTSLEQPTIKTKYTKCTRREPEWTLDAKFIPILGWKHKRDLFVRKHVCRWEYMIHLFNQSN